MGGMGDMKGILQPIRTRAINTESLSQRDPVPGLVSTLTGPLPGQNHIVMCSFIDTFGHAVLNFLHRLYNIQSQIVYWAS